LCEIRGPKSNHAPPVAVAGYRRLLNRLLAVLLFGLVALIVAAPMWQ
jgi:hypothetical protein